VLLLRISTGSMSYTVFRSLSLSKCVKEYKKKQNPS
jgi:hypothetical protein